MKAILPLTCPLGVMLILTLLGCVTPEHRALRSEYEIASNVDTISAWKRFLETSSQYPNTEPILTKNANQRLARLIEVCASDSIEVIRDFLDQYPTHAYVDELAQRILYLSTPPMLRPRFAFDRVEKVYVSINIQSAFKGLHPRGEAAYIKNHGTLLENDLKQRLLSFLMDIVDALGWQNVTERCDNSEADAIIRIDITATAHIGSFLLVTDRLQGQRYERFHGGVLISSVPFQFPESLAIQGEIIFSLPYETERQASFSASESQRLHFSRPPLSSVSIMRNLLTDALRRSNVESSVVQLIAKLGGSDALAKLREAGNVEIPPLSTPSGNPMTL